MRKARARGDNGAEQERQRVPRPAAPARHLVLLHDGVHQHEQHPHGVDATVVGFVGGPGAGRSIGRIAQIVALVSIPLVCIIAYLVLLGGIALWKSRDVKDQSDFAVAGRSLSPWMMVCTMLAVWIGTGSIVGNAEQTYESGMAAMLLPIGTLAGMALLSLIATEHGMLKPAPYPRSSNDALATLLAISPCYRWSSPTW